METEEIVIDEVRPEPTRTVAAVHHASRTRLILAFAAVYILWGSTYLAIRFGIVGFPPLLLAGLRHMTAGLILYPLARLRSCEKPTAKNWRAAALVGFLLLVCGNGALSWSEQIVPSGVAALLVATVSLWMVLIEWARKEGTRPSGRVFAGLALGFVGLAFLVGPSRFGGGKGVNLIGAGVLAFGSLCWAIGSVYSKHIQLPRSPLLGAGMQSLVGGALLLTVGLGVGEGAALHVRRIPASSVLALAYLIVFGSLVAFSAYTYLLGVASPARVCTYAYVNPVIAMFLGWLFANEAITLRTAFAGAIILTSVILVIAAPHRPARHSEPLHAANEA